MSNIRSNHHTILFSSITRYFFFLSHIRPRSHLCPRRLSPCGLSLLRLAPQYGFVGGYCDWRRNTPLWAPPIATRAAIRLRCRAMFSLPAAGPSIRTAFFWAKHTNRVTSLANPVLAITPSAIPSPIHRLPPKPSRSTSFQTSLAASNS